MSNNDQQPEIELPGYELIERIGTGGYGEVWSAIAPGGLRKAVKFVFGNQFDKRATSELHALEKVKSVRHPFLLSLERIEVIEGRLVVVSELAEGSLRDRFAECAQQGLPGIPRDELIGYLSDTADALDYLSANHDLAHLDIKPENLLLVAGHVKVADFGLVKSVNNVSQASLVGGMTPLYAGPEVFRGAPSRQSDQYSLAILYQEMLTGTPSFPGVNAAELTLQHMRDDPDLRGLAQGDRFAVARALSKSPEHRFETAGAFVAAIRSASNEVEEPGATPAIPSTSPIPTGQPLSTASRSNKHRVTEVFEANPATEEKKSTSSLQTWPEPLPNPEPTERSVPYPEETDEPFVASPAVFLGVGATGGRVLRALRAQIEEHLGVNSPLAAAPMLLLDTDPQTLASSTRAGSRALDATETILLPLRRPQQYRDKADLLLSWLGRRWLYNIPRSLRTEGIRPLGRLALVDHARQTFQRVRGLLTQAVDETSREKSTEASGLPFSGEGIRVYVVGSTAGGSGSGMSVDIAYAVRSILNRMGVEKAKIVGMMTHSTFRDATRGELARVNSYAWLSEFQRFQTSEEGYPGDPSVGVPGHEPGVGAFDDAYFIPLGNQIDTPAFESAADAIAEYLFADAFTSNQRTLDACREATRGDGATLRSLAIRHRDSQADTTLSDLERIAVSRMLDRWIGGEEDGPPSEEAGQVRSTDQVVHGAAAFLGRLQLDSSTIASNCRTLLEASLSGSAAAYAESRFGDHRCHTLAEAAGEIDNSFGVSEDDLPTQIDFKPISSYVDSIQNKLASEVANWVFGRVNEPEERLDGAERSVAWIRDYLNTVENDLRKVVARLEQEREQLLESPPKSETDYRSRLFRSRLDQAALVASMRVLEGVRRAVDSLPDELKRLREVISELRAQIIGDPSDLDPPTAESETVSHAIEARLQEDYLTAHGGLLGSIADASVIESLTDTIPHAAKVVSRDGGVSDRAAADAALAAGFAEVPLTDAGGEYCRLTLDLPSQQDATGGDENELLLVTEMCGVSLPHVAAGLIGGRRDYAAFAERVRTRRDVPWADAITGVDKKASEQPLAPLEPISTSPMETAVLS